MTTDDNADHTIALDPGVLDAIWAKFCQDTGQAGFPDFVEYLQRKGAIDADSLPPDTADSQHTVVISGDVAGQTGRPAEADSDIIAALYDRFTAEGLRCRLLTL